MISDPGVIPVKFRAPGGTIAELVPKGRYKQARRRLTVAWPMHLLRTER